jgi:hypothetical protein
MDGVEGRVEAAHQRGEEALRAAGFEGDPIGLPLEVEYGLIFYGDNAFAYGPANTWKTREWASSVDEWCMRNGVQPSSKPLPYRRSYDWRDKGVGQRGWELRPPSGRRKTLYRVERWRDALSAYRAAIESRVHILDDQLLLLGRGPNSASAPAVQRSWDLIRETSAFDGAMLRGLLAAIETRSTKAQIAASIAASKDLVEGVLRGILIDRGTPAKEVKALKIGPLFDGCRDLLFAHGDRVITDPAYATGRILTGARDMIMGLGELRNAAGGGHGRASYAAGLNSSHAAFIGDTAYALCALFAEQHLRLPR